MQTLVNLIAPQSFFSSKANGRAPTLTADDKLAMMELTCRFEWSFDARNLDALADVLSEDVVVDHLFGFREGKAAVMQMMRDVVPFTGLRHQATNPVVFVTEDGHPAVLSYLMVVQVVDENGDTKSFPRVIAHALVTDRMRKEDGIWRITRRTFEQMSIDDAYAPDESDRRKLAMTAAERAASSRA